MWTLDSELRELTGQASAEGALKWLGLLQQQENLRELTLGGEWKRGGAETYIYTFSFVGSSTPRTPLILKAYVAPPSGRTLEAGLSELLGRRFALSSHGVHTPRLYAAGKAVWLEEYLHEDILAALGDTKRRDNLCEDVLLYAVALDRLGFAPIGEFGDMRARGEQAVAVDFGQDLGPAGVSHEAEGVQASARRWLKSVCRDLDEASLPCLHARAVARFVSSLSDPLGT